MSLPVLERIAAKVAERLQRISPELNYNCELDSDYPVQRPSRASGISVRHNSIAVLQGDPEPNPDYSHEGNPPAIAWTQPFQIYCLVSPSDTLETAVDQFTNLLVTDAQRALCADDEGHAMVDWHNWDGLAVNSSLGASQEYTKADGALAGRVFTLEVIYRVDETDPRNARA